VDEREISQGGLGEGDFDDGASASEEDNIDEGSSDSWEFNVEDSEEDGFDKDVGILRAYSMVEITKGGEILWMQPLVQFFTLMWLRTLGDTRRWTREFLRAISLEYLSAGGDHWRVSRRLDMYIEAIVGTKLEKEML